MIIVIEGAFAAVCGFVIYLLGGLDHITDSDKKQIIQENSI
jgi:hypothetical protein